LGRVSPIIRQHNGFIDKYTGDGLMALFPETVEDALEAAVAMQQEVAAYNEYRRQRSHQPIQIGIGLHTGSLMLGTIGEAERMDTTVVSDAVNLASRMEGLTKIYGASIIISDHSLFQLDQPTKYHFRFLDRVKVKGKQEAVAVFEIFNGDPENIIELKLRTRTNFEKGQLFYHSQEFAKAKTYFEQVLEESPVDIAAQLYLKRVSHFLTYGAPVDWEGIESLDEK
jgi:two-component system sensor histidine kinase ChiS